MRKIYSIGVALLATAMTVSAHVPVSLQQKGKVDLTQAVRKLRDGRKSPKAMQLPSTNISPLKKMNLFTQTPISPKVSDLEGAGYGWINGPEGDYWFYTQNYTKSVNGSYYQSSTITYYDENNDTAGVVTVTVPDTMKVNMISTYGQVSTKFFDRDAKTSEVIVELHYVGDASNNYQGGYITRAYHLDGTLAYEMEGSGLFWDGSQGWNTYQRMIVPREELVGDKYRVAIDVYEPGGWTSTTPVVGHTFYIDEDLISYLEGAYINPYFIDGETYYVLSYYAKPWTSGYDEKTYDPIVTKDNSVIIETYNKKYTRVDSLSLPIVTPSDALYRFGGFGLMSDNDVSRGYFGPDGEFTYVMTWVDYSSSSDDNTYDFVIYNNKGEEQKTICTDAAEYQWYYLADVPGKSEQMAFYRTVDGTSQMQMIDVPSLEVKCTMPAYIDGSTNDDYLISTTLNRYASKKNAEGYQYAVAMSKADSQETDSTIARIGWFNPDLSLDHFTRFNLGTQGVNFTANLSDAVMTPYLVNTDNTMEYFYLCKKQRASGSSVNDNVFEIADENGKVIKSWRGDDTWAVRTPAIVPVNDTKKQLYVGMYNYDTEAYKWEIYDLPFTKFEKGGDGTASNPYLIATMGDMQQVYTEPAASYKVINNIDMSAAMWTPVSNFTGTFNGDGYALDGLNIKSSTSSAGLFASLGNGAKVSNLTLTEPRLELTSSNQYVGILAGDAIGDSITNVHIYDAQITGAESDGTVGGIIGQASVYSCVATSSFQGVIKAEKATAVGGICGETRTSSDVRACVTSGDYTAASGLGGIVGSIGNGSYVKDNHSDATLNANHSVGGIAGIMVNMQGRGYIDHCYYTGNINAGGETISGWSGIATGGIVGEMESLWASSTTVKYVSNSIFLGNITATIPSDKADAASSLHAIAGWTVNNEDSKQKESGLATNYVTADALVNGAAVTSNDDTSVHGAVVNRTDITDETLQGIGYVYGDSIQGPWLSQGSNMPVLYFEKTPSALILSDAAVDVYTDATTTITATVYGVTADAIEVTSADSQIADVEISDFEENGGTATISIIGKTAGTTSITVSDGTHTATITVTVSEPTAIANVISGDNASAQQRIYTLSGQPVSNMLRPGVYILKQGNKSVKVVKK